MGSTTVPVTFADTCADAAVATMKSAEDNKNPRVTSTSQEKSSHGAKGGRLTCGPNGLCRLNANDHDFVDLIRAAAASPFFKCISRTVSAVMIDDAPIAKVKGSPAPAGRYFQIHDSPD